MDFTREPIIETVITPKEGCKLVVRSSKGTAQEEYFVDAVEVVSFGHFFFFRSLERPKTFLVPATDYEVLEVRETRMVLKNVGVDRAAIKIAGGREAQMRAVREPPQERYEQQAVAEEPKVAAESSSEQNASAPKSDEARPDKKRDRRRQYRRRRGRDGAEEEEGVEGQKKPEGQSAESISEGDASGSEETSSPQQMATTSVLTSLLPPPPTLISETIARYKDNILFKDAFYTREPHRNAEKPQEIPLNTQEKIPLEQPEYGSFEVTEEEEEEIYQRRKEQMLQDTGEDEKSMTNPDSVQNVDSTET